MQTLRPNPTLFLASSLLLSCAAPLSSTAPEQTPLAFTYSFSISLNDQVVSTPTLLLYEGENGGLAREEENGARLEAEVNAKGSAHVKYVPVPGGPQHNLVIKPNTQATIQVDQGEMKIDFQRQPTGEQQFEKMKSLVGKWHSIEKGESGPNEVIYSLTADGTAVQERLFPGETHEMVTMYFLDNGRLTMTHFCSMGNQPSMVAIPGSPDEIHFKFKSATNLKSPKDGYMHDLVYTFHDQNRVDANWGSWKDGKEQHRMLFPFVRK